MMKDGDDLMISYYDSDEKMHSKVIHYGYDKVVTEIENLIEQGVSSTQISLWEKKEFKLNVKVEIDC